MTTAKQRPVAGLARGSILLRWFRRLSEGEESLMHEYRDQ